MTQLRRLAASWHPLSSVTYSTLILVLLWIGYHRFIIGQDDPNRCHALLNQGSWSPRTSHDDLRWEPKGCRMVDYSADAFHDCLGSRKVILAGDSTIRQIYWAAARKLDPVRADVQSTQVAASGEKHHDLSFEAEGVRLQFIWDPWLNSTSLNDALRTFRTIPATPNGGALKKKDDESAALIVLGSPGLWAARYGGDDYLDLFKRGLNGISTYLSSASLDEEAIAAALDTSAPHFSPANQILLTPVQVPPYDILSDGRSETITPERIDKMNDYLAHLPPNQTSHIVWSFNQMTRSSSEAFGKDGLRVEGSIADAEIDVLLNSHCNTLAAHHDHSLKGTCCVAEPRNELYNLALVFLCVIMLYVPRYHYVPGFMRRVSITPELITAARDLLVALVWCWICDGTLQFSKVERHYHQAIFVFVSLLWLVGSTSVLHKFIRLPSEPLWSAIRDTKQEEHGDRGFLNRDQTDEIKGLMQGLILLYHYNHASQALWVYKIVRVLIAGYFFLSSYGHTRYVLKTGDYSFQRVAIVLFRTNALSALLPYMMGTTYNNYYFAPTITFYYLVVWLMLRVFTRSNSDPWPLAMKVLTTASFTSVFIRTPGYLEATTSALQTIFRMSLDPNELRFRLALDRHIVFVGVMVASLVNTAAVADAGELFTAKTSSRTMDNGRARFYGLASVGLCLFLYITQTHLSTKEGYNTVHPYISWIPILAFIALRNLHPPWRKAYLALPAELGKISLETYVLQYHIWLGGDATAKLTMGFTSWFGSLFEKAIITILFVGIAALTHRATRVFTNSVSVRGFLAFLAAMWMGNLVYG
ncbi:Cas1p-domain-containing protein [Xylariaceae sp. FL0016]|nr:Cas1p-domain-containing protein [Xylariaceae sp. FL0016]